MLWNPDTDVGFFCRIETMQTLGFDDKNLRIFQLKDSHFFGSINAGIFLLRSQLWTAKLQKPSELNRE
jgi:hypothetical protein